ncbi:MAG: hypothetical protein AAGI01_07705 [Myxococcota bacterium]
MSDLSIGSPKGVLLHAWSATVGEYAIAGRWLRGADLLVVGDAAGGVYGFDGASGELLWFQPEAHAGGLLAMAAHPNGATLATTGQDGRVLLWDSASGHVRRAIELGRGWVEHVAWSSNGEMLAAALSRRVHVFGADAEEVWRTGEHRSTVSAIAWSGSQELATTSYGQVAFFDAASGDALETFEWRGSLVSMVLSPDKDIVACGAQDNSVHFWRRSTGEDSMMSGYPGKPSALAFDSTGALLATGGGEYVTVWSFSGGGPEGTQPGVLELHVRPITTLAFAHRGRRLASGGRDGVIVVWELQEDGGGSPVGLAIAQDVVSGLAWSSGDRALAAFDATGDVTVWRVRD